MGKVAIEWDLKHKSRNNKKVDNGVLWNTASKTRCFDVGLIVF